MKMYFSFSLDLKPSLPIYVVKSRLTTWNFGDTNTVGENIIATIKMRNNIWYPL